jgi:sulfite exporter TauE/SafE
MEAPVVYRGILTGIALMFAFGIGTVPALFLVAKLVDMGWLKSRDIIYRIGGALMIGVGIYFVISAIQY